VEISTTFYAQRKETRNDNPHTKEKGSVETLPKEAHTFDFLDKERYKNSYFKYIQVTEGSLVKELKGSGRMMSH
jgi:hypothetical protein